MGSGCSALERLAARGRLMKTLAATLAHPQTAPEGGSTLSRILANVPTDPASVITLLLLVAGFVLVLWFGRPKGGKTRP
jgi:hypothetical protein